MKAPRMSKEQYKGIHDIANDQGFPMHYRAISNTVSYLEVLRCERIKAKQKDGLTSFLMLSVLEAKIFQCVVPENIHTPTTEGIGIPKGRGGQRPRKF